ncbi:MAG: hypothetical protein ACLT76_12595 [Clostridium fessum]
MAMRQADQEYDGSIVSASGMAGRRRRKLHAYNAPGRSLAGEYMLGLVMESGENGRVQRLYETNRGGSDAVKRMRGDSGGIFVV